MPPSGAVPASAEADLEDLLTGPVEQVAPLLLGGELRHGPVAVRITEVEAYGGLDDPGSHAFRGETTRNRVMFGPPGHLYCYRSHGIHVCANVSVGPAGDPAAVLLRAGTVTRGLAIARVRRGGRPDADLAAGPGKLCQALAITLDHDGADLRGGAVVLRLPTAERGPVGAGPRVGVRRAADRPWRFWLPGEAVSSYRRNPRAEPEW